MSKLDNIKVGDVLRAPSGRLRLVRAVHNSFLRKHWKNNPKSRIWVYFVINHCSWTKRPYTLYTVAELERQDYRKMPASFKLNDKFQRLLIEEIETNVNNFTCCDVVGIP